MFREDNARKCVTRKELLGTGSFGSVYRGDWLKAENESDKDVAIKIIAYSGDQIEKIGRELYFLKRFNSPFAVKYFDSFLYHFELWIIMELCDAGSLLDIYRISGATLNEKELKAVVACSILGLLHIHEQRCIHRDIKSGNILLSSTGKAMLSDFGISTKLTDNESKRKTVVGTPYWMAPEILLETAYGENVDVWSLGITVIEMAEGKPPHSGVKPISAMFLISYRPAPELAEPSKWSDDMVKFVNRCLNKDPSMRANTAELVAHPWIKDEIKVLNDQQSKSSMCTLPILRELALRNWDAISAKRQKVDEIDLFDAELVDDCTETWDALDNNRAMSSTLDPHHQGLHSEKRTWDTASFQDSHFRGSPLRKSFESVGLVNENGALIKPGSPAKPEASPPKTSPINHHLFGSVTDNNGATMPNHGVNNKHNGGLDRTVSITLGTSDTFVRNPSKKLSRRQLLPSQRSIRASGTGATFSTAFFTANGTVEVGFDGLTINNQIEHKQTESSTENVAADDDTVVMNDTAATALRSMIASVDVNNALLSAEGQEKSERNIITPKETVFKFFEVDKNVDKLNVEGRDSEINDIVHVGKKKGRRPSYVFHVPDKFTEVVDKLTKVMDSLVSPDAMTAFGGTWGGRSSLVNNNSNNALENQLYATQPPMPESTTPNSASSSSLNNSAKPKRRNSLTAQISNKVTGKITNLMASMSSKKLPTTPKASDS